METKVKAFERIVQPYNFIARGAKQRVSCFCKINWDGKRLSITGVQGDGEAWGAWGQIRNSMGSAWACAEQSSYGQGWTAELYNKFLLMWERWHLNDMRPFCPHQRDLGWQAIALEEVVQYTWELNGTLAAEQHSLEQTSLRILADKGIATLTKKEQAVLRIPYEVITYTDVCPDGYVLSKKETKLLGWLRPGENERGILCRPCPTCGHEYGSAWLYEDVPADVLTFFKLLPAATDKPAWV